MGFFHGGKRKDCGEKLNFSWPKFENCIDSKNIVITTLIWIRCQWKQDRWRTKLSYKKRSHILCERYSPGCICLFQNILPKGYTELCMWIAWFLHRMLRGTPWVSYLYGAVLTIFVSGKRLKMANVQITPFVWFCDVSFHSLGWDFIKAEFNLRRKKFEQCFTMGNDWRKKSWDSVFTKNFLRQKIYRNYIDDAKWK